MKRKLYADEIVVLKDLGDGNYICISNYCTPLLISSEQRLRKGQRIKSPFKNFLDVYRCLFYCPHF